MAAGRYVWILRVEGIDAAADQRTGSTKARLGGAAGGGGRGLCRCGLGTGPAGAPPGWRRSRPCDGAGLRSDPPASQPGWLAGPVGQDPGGKATAQIALAPACGPVSAPLDGAHPCLRCSEHGCGSGESRWPGPSGSRGQRHVALRSSGSGSRPGVGDTLRLGCRSRP